MASPIPYARSVSDQVAEFCAAGPADTSWPGSTGRGPPQLLNVAKAAFEASADLRLLDPMPIGLAIYDRAGALMHHNPEFSRLLGNAGMPSIQTDHWYGGTLPLEDYPCRRALRGETVCPGVDLRRHVPGDDAMWLSVSAAPIRDGAEGAILGVVLLFLAAGERRLPDFATLADRSFRQFADASASGIWIATATTGDYGYRNPRHRLIGGRAGSMRSIADWLHGVTLSDRGAVKAHFDRAGQGATDDYRYSVGGGAGRRLLRETCFPIRDDVGAIVMIGGICEDVTPHGAPLYLIGGGPAAIAALDVPAQAHITRRFGTLAELLGGADFLLTGCVVVDIASTPDCDALLARFLAAHGGRLPTILLGDADTSAATAVSAMRLGAADYLVAPHGEDDLADALLAAAARIPAMAGGDGGEGADRLARLTRREREVLTGLVGGGTNKSIGRMLGISPRTVEVHRARLMERMNARTLAELIRTAQNLG